MKFEIQKEESCKKVYRVAFESEEVKKAKKDAYNKTKGKYVLPGFRKGKVPMQIIEMHYGKDIFLLDGAEALVNNAIRDIFLKEDRAMGEPKVSIVEMEGENIVLDVDVLMLPAVKIEKYTGLDIEAPNNEVDTTRVEKELEALKEKATRFETVEKPVEEGFTAVIDFVGKIDGEEFEGGKGEDHNLVIGKKQFIDGFEDQLVGHKAGETVEVKVTFPEDYHAEELKGKDAVFTVTIKEVKEPLVPEIDDEFISDSTEFETVEEFKANVLKVAELEKKLKDEKDAREAILEKIIAENPFEVSDELVDVEIERSLQEVSNQLAQMGLKFEDYLQMFGKTLEEMKEEQRPDATTNLKRGIVLLALIDAENIEVKDPEEAREITKRVLELQGIDYDEVKEQLTDDYIASINSQLVEFKLFEVLKEKNFK